MTYIFYIEFYNGPSQLLKEMKADINHLEDFQMDNLLQNGRFITERQIMRDDISSEEEAKRILEQLRKENPGKRVRFFQLPS